MELRSGHGIANDAEPAVEYVDQGGPADDVQLPVDLGQVQLDGALGHKEGPGDLPVRVSLGASSRSGAR